MRRWLRQEHAGTRVDEPPIETEPEELLNCTPTAQLATSLQGETASSINSRRFAAISPTRGDVRDKVLRLTRYARAEVPLNLQTLDRGEAEGYRFERLPFDTAPGLSVPALLVTPAPASAPTRAALHVNQSGKDAGGKPRADVIELARQGYADQWFGQERITWLGLMTGRPLVSLPMRDLPRGIDVLEARGFQAASDVPGVGRGLVPVALPHAAAIDARAGRLILEDMPCSYAAIARAPMHRKIFEVVIPGVLGEYDPPDLLASMAPRPVTPPNLRSPTGARMLRRDQAAEDGYAAET
jgi:hypothetical protein